MEFIETFTWIITTFLGFAFVFSLLVLLKKPKELTPKNKKHKKLDTELHWSNHSQWGRGGCFRYYFPLPYVFFNQSLYISTKINVLNPFQVSFIIFIRDIKGNGFYNFVPHKLNILPIVNSHGITGMTSLKIMGYCLSKIHIFLKFKKLNF